MAALSREAREYSKVFFPNERKQMAAEVKQERRQQKENREEKRSEIADLENQAKNKTLKAEVVAAKIDAIKKKLEEKHSSIMRRVFNFIKIRNLRQELSLTQGKMDIFRKEIQDLQETITALNEETNSRQFLSDLQAKLDDFYQQQERSWNEYRSNWKQRDLATVMKKYEVFCLHGFLLFTPLGNTVIKKDIPWEDKLKIVISLKPAIAASTFRPGGGEEFPGDIGVILKSGEIKSAYPSDSSSVAIKRGKRVHRNGGQQYSLLPKRQQEPDMEKNIEHAIRERGKNYNELVVSEPEVAGLFIREGMRYDNAIYLSRRYNLPIYLIKKEGVFSCKISNKNHELIVADQVMPDEIIDTKFTVSPAVRQIMQIEVFENRPFDAIALGIKEAAYFDSFAEGQLLFEKMRLLNHPEKTLSSLPSDRIERLYTQHFLVYDKILYHKSGNLWEGHSAGGARKVVLGKEIIVKTRIGHTSWLELSRSFTSFEDYLIGCSNLLMEIKEKLEKIPNFSREKQFLQDQCRQVSFHIYGFSERAKQSGNDLIAQKAKSLASKIVSDEQYQDYKRRRVDKNGHFVITKADLE